jgi:serine/threonine-protein kinase
MSVVPTLVGNRFQLDRMLGRDAVSEVWSARDVHLGNPVAVRMLSASALDDPVALRRLDAEARAVAGLAHPNTVAVYDSGLEGGHAYQVLELVDGPSLAAVLAAGPLPATRAVDIAAQICAALSAVHAAGVVHRDLGPDDVLLGPDGVVKVGGFGIAHLRADTPNDPRTDLYAVGWLLYAMLVGGPPPVDHHGAVPALRDQRLDVSPELAALVGQLLAVNPANPSGPALSAEEAGRRLTEAPEWPPARTVAVGRPRHSATAAEWSRWRRPAILAAVAVAVLVTLLTVALVSRDRGRPAAAPSAPASPTIIETVTEPTATPDASPSPSPTPTASASRAPRAALLIAALRSRLPGLVQDGELTSRSAQELDRRLGDAARSVAANQPTAAWNTMQVTADRVVRLHRQHKITDAGYDVLKAALAEIADALPH